MSIIRNVLSIGFYVMPTAMYHYYILLSPTILCATIRYNYYYTIPSKADECNGAIYLSLVFVLLSSRRSRTCKYLVLRSSVLLSSISMSAVLRWKTYYPLSVVSCQYFSCVIIRLLVGCHQCSLTVFAEQCVRSMEVVPNIVGFML